MEERLQAFLNALSDNTAYDYIANHYYEFGKDELKDIILECLHPITGKEKVTPQALDIKAELEFRWDCVEVEDDYASNAPCDTTGICAGRSCSQFYSCNDAR